MTPSGGPPSPPPGPTSSSGPSTTCHLTPWSHTRRVGGWVWGGSTCLLSVPSSPICPHPASHPYFPTPPPTPPPSADVHHLRDPAFLTRALRYRTARLLHTLAARLRKHSRRLGEFGAWNKCLLHVLVSLPPPACLDQLPAAHDAGWPDSDQHTPPHPQLPTCGGAAPSTSSHPPTQLTSAA